MPQTWIRKEKVGHVVSHSIFEWKIIFSIFVIFLGGKDDLFKKCFNSRLQRITRT